MEYIHNLIWLCPLLFAAGFIDSIAGGGGLIAMPAYMMCGMPIHLVYGCNKFQCAFGSTAAALKYFKSGCLDLKITAVSATTSFLFSMLGTRIIFYLSDSQIRTMLMFLLPMTALLVVFVKNAWNYTARTQPLTARSVLMALITGMVIGLYDSLYGPGGGTIALLLFTFLLRYDVRTSSGNAKMVLIVSNYTALLSYLISGNVAFAVAVPCAVCNVLGNYIGAGFAVKKGAKIIRPLMICVVIVLILKLILGS
ncbi:MAG: TSUP family transporter [Oscillospiraceae bacterium]|nr:TSUP family transporter [Oscillospiraceae bacterium]